MAHVVTGFLARTDFVSQICLRNSALRAVSLEQRFSLFPLPDELLQYLHIPLTKGLEDEKGLPEELTKLLSQLSSICPLLYFETEYFGGWGSQLAVVFENERIIFGPAENTVGPINDGLNLLGVRPQENNDEFDSIGLGKHRSTSDWFE